MEIVSAAADRTTIEPQKRFSIFVPSSILMPCHFARLHFQSDKNDPVEQESRRKYLDVPVLSHLRLISRSKRDSQRKKSKVPCRISQNECCLLQFNTSREFPAARAT